MEVYCTPKFGYQKTFFTSSNFLFAIVVEMEISWSVISISSITIFFMSLFFLLFFRSFLVTVMSKAGQLVKMSLPADVSSLKLLPNFIFPNNSPGLAYLAVDEFVEVGIRRYFDTSCNLQTTLNSETLAN